MPTEPVVQLFIDTTGPLAPCRFQISRTSQNTRQGITTFVQGDRVKLAIWLLAPPPAIGEPSVSLENEGPVAFAIKQNPSDVSYLALCTSFTYVTDAINGDHYEGILNLNTTEMGTAFTTAGATVNTLACWFDFELTTTATSTRQTYQNRVTIYREVYTGTQPPPEALPEWPMPADIPNKPSADGYGRIVVKDGTDGLLKLSKLAFNLLSPGVVELASATASTLSITEPTLRIGAATGSSSTTVLSIGNAACATEMLGDFDFSGATTNSLVRYDVAQTLTAPQQAKARTNIGIVTDGGVYCSASVGGGFLPHSTIPGAKVVAVCADLTGSSGYIISMGSPWDDGSIGISSNGTTLNVYEGYLGGAFAHTYDLAIPTGAKWLWFVDNDTTFSIFFDDAASPAATYTRKTSAAVVFRSLGSVGGTCFIGRIYESHIFNRALTVEERAAVMRGEVPAALAVRGENKVGIISADCDLGTGASIAANTVTHSLAAYTFTNIHIGRTKRVSVGDKIIVRGSVVQKTAALYLNMFNPSSGGGPCATKSIGDFPVGDFVCEYTITVAGTDCFILYETAGAGDAVRIDSVDYIGTVARYEPENVTSLGRWIDSSGNGYDLIPGAGITPLKPQPPCLRSVSIGIDGFGSSFTNLPPGWSASKIAAGDYRITCPTYINNATAQGVHGGLLIAPGSIAGEFFPGANLFGVYAFGTADVKADAYARVTPHWTE